jgi:hypothetical protein
LTVIHAQIKHCYTVHLALLTKSDLEDVSLQKLARLSLLKIIMVLSILRDEIMTVLCLREPYFHEAYYSICTVKRVDEEVQHPHLVDAGPIYTGVEKRFRHP